MKQTPYWKKGHKEIKLSVADKVCLILKINNGSWRRFLKERKREAERKEELEQDYQRAKRIREFERKHKIRFVQDGDNLCDFYWTPRKQ